MNSIGTSLPELTNRAYKLLDYRYFTGKPSDLFVSPETYQLVNKSFTVSMNINMSPYKIPFASNDVANNSYWIFTWFSGTSYQILFRQCRE